jgi:magnesium-transporting ATPase (P-type)
MVRPPRDQRTPIITRSLATRLLLVSFLMLIAAFRLFTWELAAGATLAEARTAAVNVFVMIELCYLFNCRSLLYAMGARSMVPRHGSYREKYGHHARAVVVLSAARWP